MPDGMGLCPECATNTAVSISRERMVMAPLVEMWTSRAAYDAAYTSNVLATSISPMPSVRATPIEGRPHGMRALSPTRFDDCPWEGVKAEIQKNMIDTIGRLVKKIS